MGAVWSQLVTCGVLTSWDDIGRESTPKEHQKTLFLGLTTVMLSEVKVNRK